MKNTQKYSRIDLAGNVYPQGMSGVSTFRDVDAVPTAGTIDIVLPHKDGGQQIVSVPWVQVKSALRVVPKAE